MKEKKNINIPTVSFLSFVSLLLLCFTVYIHFDRELRKKNTKKLYIFFLVKSKMFWGDSLKCLYHSLQCDSFRWSFSHTHTLHSHLINTKFLEIYWKMSGKKHDHVQRVYIPALLKSRRLNTLNLLILYTINDGSSGNDTFSSPAKHEKCCALHF